MNYDELKDGERINMYVPACKQFFKMAVTKTIDDGFSISNLSFNKNKLIEGHQFVAFVKNQKDIDAFFYLQKGKITDESYIKANEHYLKNNKSWIF